MERFFSVVSGTTNWRLPTGALSFSRFFSRFSFVFSVLVPLAPPPCSYIDCLGPRERSTFSRELRCAPRTTSPLPFPLHSVLCRLCGRSLPLLSCSRENPPTDRCVSCVHPAFLNFFFYLCAAPFLVLSPLRRYYHSPSYRERMGELEVICL